MCRIQQQQRQNVINVVRMLATAPKQETTPTATVASVQPTLSTPVQTRQSESDSLYR